MEEHQMWQKTFGFEYSTNNDFEQAMLGAYAKKLGMEYLI
jgi:spore photoproduct lyase